MDSSDPEIGTKKHSSLKKGRKSFFKQFFVDYTESTTLHGLKYTTQRGVHTIEKIFWVMTFILSLGMCVWLIRNVWYKWQTSPIIVSFSEKVVSVEMVPFPSLTICPQIKAQTDFYNYTKQRLMILKSMEFTPSDSNNSTTMDSTEAPSAESIKKFQDVSLICPLPNYMEQVEFDGYANVTNVSTINNIVDVSPRVYDYFYQCRWLGNYKSCSEIFAKVLTEEGVCFNFNGLAANEIFRYDTIQRDYNYNDANKNSSGWDLNYGYNNNEDVDYMEQYPYRAVYIPIPIITSVESSVLSKLNCVVQSLVATMYGSHDPYLEVIFKTSKSDYDENCNVLNKGFKVYTQHPASQPQSTVYSYAVLPGQVSALAMKVSMMNTSEKLMKYDAKIRQCYFSTEKYLRYFKLYTERNCMLECMSNYIYQRCQCVPFHMPYSDSRTICTIQQAGCIREARGFKKNLIKFTEKCSCLPNCNSITYSAEILKTEFNMEKNFIKHLQETLGGIFGDEFYIEAYLRGFEYSKLEVYYRDSGFVSITRSELYGITDFLANIGGLLGLFLGFSFLSIIEIVYFFTFRLGFSFRNHIKNERSDTDENAASGPTDADNDNITTIKVKYI